MANTVAPVPYDADAETALLGSLLIDAEAVAEVEAIVTAGDFYVQRHAFVYDAILAASRNGGADPVTISEYLEQRGRFDDAGGMAFITSLVSAVPSSLHARRYAEVVRERSGRRQVLLVADILARCAHDLEEPLPKIVDEGMDSLAYVEEWSRAGVRLWSAADLLADTTPVQPDVVASFVKGESAHVFAGDGGTGKSYALLDMALCIANGLPWLGLATQQAPVLFVDLENRAHRTRERITAAMRGHDLAAPGPMHFAFELQSRLDSDRATREVSGLARRCGARLVILDSLADFLGQVEENDNADMGQVAARLRAICGEIGGSTIAIHHVPKYGSGPRGATALVAGVDVSIDVTRDGDTLRMKQSKNRDGAEVTLSARMNWGEGAFNLSPLARSVGRTAKVADIDEQAILDELGDGEPHESSDVLRAAMRQTGHSRRTMQLKLKGLIDDGLVSSRDAGRGKPFVVWTDDPEGDDDSRD